MARHFEKKMRSFGKPLLNYIFMTSDHTHECESLKQAQRRINPWSKQTKKVYFHNICMKIRSFIVAHFHPSPTKTSVV